MDKDLQSIKSKLDRASDTKLFEMQTELSNFIESPCWMYIDDYCNAYEEANDLVTAVEDELYRRGLLESEPEDSEVE